MLGIIRWFFEIFDEILIFCIVVTVNILYTVLKFFADLYNNLAALTTKKFWLTSSKNPNLKDGYIAAKNPEALSAQVNEIMSHIVRIVK